MSIYDSTNSTKAPQSIMKKPKEDDKKSSNALNSIGRLSVNSSLNESGSGQENRKDKYGNPILRKNKDHKISFSDQFKDERSLVQVNKVESFKAVNSNEEQGERKCMNCIII